VRYERGALRIEGSAIARDEARIGEMVRVQNPTSRRELVGRLGPDGAVHVSF
jgi:flagella basal body P-ring formation protein FlgA